MTYLVQNDWHWFHTKISKKKKKKKTDGEKKLEDTGVKFDPTPEVIQVAATAPEPAVDLDNNGTKDDDEDLLMEEF